jgi:hypothetical protein
VERARRQEADSRKLAFVTAWMSAWLRSSACLNGKCISLSGLHRSVEHQAQTNLRLAVYVRAYGLRRYFAHWDVDGVGHISAFIILQSRQSATYHGVRYLPDRLGRITGSDICSPDCRNFIENRTTFHSRTFIVP